MTTSRAFTVLSGVIACAAYAALAFASHDSPVPIAVFFGCMGVAGAACALVFARSYQGKLDLRLSDVLVFALVFRLIGAAGEPLLEDDHYRYLWDAHVFASSGTPYGTAPTNAFESDVPEPFEPVLDGINHPDIGTVYGPTAQWLFRLAYEIRPAEVWPLQVLMAVADLAVIFLLSRVVAPMWLLLYAWSPLMLKEFAFTAHPDVFTALLTIAALAVRHREQARPPSAWPGITVGCLLALAVGTKLYCVIAVPFLLQWQWRAYLSFLVTALLIASPFGVIEAWFPEGLRAMGGYWLFNAPVHVLALEYYGWTAVQWLKLLSALILLGTGAVMFWRHCRPPRMRLSVTLFSTPPVAPGRYVGALAVLFALMHLTAPVLNPWYLATWLAISVLVPSWTAWFTSFAVLLSYATGINLGEAGATLELYEVAPWATTIEVLLIATGIALDFIRRNRLRNQQAPT